MKRIALIGACLLPVFVFVNFFQFNSWFYNNEMPAYLRVGVISGDASGPIKRFYEVSRDACPTWHPNLVEQCQSYQTAHLGTARYVRPFASSVGALMTFLVPGLDFMQALKFGIIGLAIGGAIFVGLLLLPFLATVKGTGLAAIGLIWIGGWIGTRLLHVESLGNNVLFAAFALLLIASAFLIGRSQTSFPLKFEPLIALIRSSREKITISVLLSLLGIGLCFAVGYRVHIVFESRFPFLYLLLSFGLWILLSRALPQYANWLLCGFLAASLYLMSTLVPAFYNLSLPKAHQLTLVGVLIFTAIWRDDARVYWGLPLILLFDMQNATRVCSVIIVVEGFVGALRRQAPIAIAPAALTGVIGLVVTATTAYYPFGDQLYSISDAIGVLLTPQVLAGGFAACLIIRHVFWSVRDEKSREAVSHVAVDRMFIYVAAVVVMGAIQIPTYGLLFDAFQLSNLFRGVATAPALAIFAVVVGLLREAYRKKDSPYQASGAVVPIAAVLLLMSATPGGIISLAQLKEGILSSTTRHLPRDWPRRTPVMTMSDNIVYYDASNLMTAALMQYSIIKILLLSRNPAFSGDQLIVRPFDPRSISGSGHLRHSVPRRS